jgi:DNA invertase Pin-like site-specific DNA recombinase
MIEKATASCGAKVLAADGAGNGDSPADAFMRSILDAAAAYERALIRARTKAALQAKKSRGEAAGEVPYGFRVEEGKLVKDDAEQRVIRAVVELRHAGLSYRRIVSELAALGFVSRSGRPLQLTQVVRLSHAA